MYNYWSATQALSQEFIQSCPSFHPYWYGNAGVSQQVTEMRIPRSGSTRQRDLPRLKYFELFYIK